MSSTNYLYSKIRKLEKEIKILKAVPHCISPITNLNYEKQPDGTYQLKYTYNVQQFMSIPINNNPPQA